MEHLFGEATRTAIELAANARDALGRNPLDPPVQELASFLFGLG